MMHYVLRWLLLLCFGISAHAWAQAPKVMARASLQNTEPAIAGQQVQLKVDALTTTWFTKAPTYPTINLPGAIVTLPDVRSQNFNETIGNETWFGVSRTYVITPTGDGDITLPPLELTLYPGQGDGPVTATAEAITLKVKQVERPVGVGNKLVSTDVQVKQTLDKKLEELKVGDALTRTIEIQAVGAQGMFIPPVSFPKIEGLRVYPKTGNVDNQIKDKEGVLGSTRIDAATYVIQTAGKYTLPKVTVEWWNPASGKPEKTAVPAVEFKAAPNSSYQTEFSLPQNAVTTIGKVINWHFIGLLVSAALLLSLLIYALMHYLPRLFARVRAWQMAKQERYAASELAAFRQLEQAIATGDATQAYPALLNWAEHPERPSNQRGLDTLCKHNPAINTHIDALRAAIYDTPKSQWQGSALLQSVTQLRNQQQPIRPSGTRLQPLNLT